MYVCLFIGCCCFFSYIDFFDYIYSSLYDLFGFFFRKTDAFWQFVHLFVFMNCHKAVIAPG